MPPEEQNVPPVIDRFPSDRSSGGVFKKISGWLVAAGVLLLKFFGQIKFFLLPALKFLPILLKTGGTMLISIWAYSMFWGPWFAAGFVVLIFVHECGHLVAARMMGLRVGAPVFIPFMGALIALKEAPRDAWVEAVVGIGGPMLGSVGAGVCGLIYMATGNELFRALAYTGCFLNLFNLAPLSPLDGGRIATALSPWLWIVGFVILVAMTVLHPNFLLILILIMSLPRVFFLFRAKTVAERRYFEVPPARRVVMAVLYFGLAALLAVGMEISFIPHGSL